MEVIGTCPSVYVRFGVKLRETLQRQIAWCLPKTVCENLCLRNKILSWQLVAQIKSYLIKQFFRLAQKVGALQTPYSYPLPSPWALSVNPKEWPFVPRKSIDESFLGCSIQMLSLSVRERRNQPSVTTWSKYFSGAKNICGLSGFLGGGNLSY